MTVPGFPLADCTYGGSEPHDNSGRLRYVSIRHGGDEIGNGNELNGLSLGGVGDGTTIDNVEIYCNFDDGFEWFGGTVNGTHLAVFFHGDDMLDLDEGYTGVNQFLFGVQPFFNKNGGTACGSASGDKIGENDGDNNLPDNVAQNDNVTTGSRRSVSTTDPTAESAVRVRHVEQHGDRHPRRRRRSASRRCRRTRRTSACSGATARRATSSTASSSTRAR